MATIPLPVQNKRTHVPGRAPQPSDLLEGQLALNLSDGAIYSKTNAGAIIKIGVATSDLKTVAFTGAYSDLTGKPTIPAPYVLPEATADALGGIKVGLGLQVDAGLVQADVLSVRGQNGSAKTGNVEITRTDMGLDILDVNNVIKTEYLPPSILGGNAFQGGWNATTNTPVIPAAAAGNKGWFYIVETAGNTPINGITTWNIGDQLLSDGAKWIRIAGTATAVVSINGATGVVVLNASNLPGLSVVGRTGQYTDLLNVPTSFPPSVHTQPIESITGASEVAKTGSYNDLLDLPPDPRLKSIGMSASGTPVIFPATYIFTQRIQFAQNFAGSKAAFLLQAGVNTEVLIKRGAALTPNAFTLVGRITSLNGNVTFTTENPAPIDFEVGDVLRYEWNNANISTASISLNGTLLG